jgi:hypothetical protein
LAARFVLRRLACHAGPALLLSRGASATAFPAMNAARPQGFGLLPVPIVGASSSGLLLSKPLGLRHLAALALTLGGVMLASRA